MISEPIFVTAEAQPVVQTTTQGVEMAPPSLVQQQTADGLFSPEVQQAAALVMGVHTGMTLLQHIIAEARPTQEEQPPPRRSKPGDLEPAV